MTPRRIQMTRARPWRAEHPEAVIVARPGPFGNPFKVGNLGIPDAEVAAYRFRLWTESTVEGRAVAARAKHELRGRDLACWCPLDGPCHADVLLRLANEED